MAAAMLGVTAAACTATAREPRWDVLAATVPAGLEFPFPEGGRVTASLDASTHTVAMVAYPQQQAADVLDELAEWISAHRPTATRSTGSIFAENQTVWEVRWTDDDLVLIVVQCFDPTDGDFTLVCVTAAEGDAPTYRSPP